MPACAQTPPNARANPTAAQSMKRHALARRHRDGGRVIGAYDNAFPHSSALRPSMDGDTRLRLAARVDDIEPFHVMEVQTAARALEAAGRDIVHLEIGEPDFPTPEPVLAAARAALAGGGIYYTSALGLPELRAAIATHYRDHYGVTVSPERIV